MGTSAILKPAQFTFSAWVFSNATTTGQAIFKPSYSDGYTSGFEFYIDGSGRVGFRYGNGIGFVGGFSTTSPTDYRGAWHLMSVTFDGATTTIYVDGVQNIASSTPTFGYKAANEYAEIGGSDGANALNGTLDDARFYSRALTPSEISNVYNNTSIPTSGLIFYMPFSEGAGTVTADNSVSDGSQSLPWKTIGFVNSFLYQPGDSILFKKGDTWNESLTVPSSGTNGNPITFGAYGSGSNPVIDGSTIINPAGWVVCGLTYCNDSHIYVASTTLAGATVANVFVDGQSQYDIAHYPYVPYATTTSASSPSNYIIDTNFSPPSADLANASVAIRTNAWTIETKKITAYNSGTHTLSLDSNTSTAIPSGNGFYLTNKLWMLDHPGEWYYSTSTNNLYVWMADGSNPDTHIVEAAPVSTVGVTISNQNDVTLQDLTVRNTGNYGVYGSAPSRLTVQRLNVAYAGTEGIYIRYY